MDIKGRKCGKSVSVLIGLVLNTVILLDMIVVEIVVVWCNGIIDVMMKGECEIVIGIDGIESRLPCSIVVKDWRL